MIKFRQKEFGSIGNILGGALKGATIGGLLSGGATNLINNGLPAYPTFKSANKPYKQSWNKLAGKVNDRSILRQDNIRTDKKGNIISSTDIEGFNSPESDRKIITTGVGIIVGAALGALVAGTKELLSKSSNIKFTSGLLSKVTSELRASGFKSGEDYTLSPSEATDLGTKVCIVLTRDGSGLRTLINSKNDPELKKISDNALSTISRKAKVRNSNASDRFNEIKISTVSDGLSSDARMVSGIAKTFIQAGYPVYLIEVG